MTVDAQYSAPDTGSAWAKFKAGDWETAEKELREILAKWPDDFRTRLRLARVLARSNQTSAEEHFRYAMSLAPKNVKAMVALADFLFAQRRWDEAGKMYELALTHGPQHLEGIVGLARVRLRRKRRPEAYKLYAKAIATHPRNAKTYREFAAALGEHAVRMAEKAADIEGESPATDGAMIAALKAAGRFGQAEALLSRRLLGRPDDDKLRQDVAQMREFGAASRDSRRPAPWPRRVDQLADFEAAVRKYVIAGMVPSAPVINPASNVIALGSCFAENLAIRLRERGLDVFFQKRSEDLDNLYATSEFLDAIASNKETTSNPFALGEAQAAVVRQRFLTADTIILSLGVSAAYFNRSTGEFMMPSTSVDSKHLFAISNQFRMLSVSENLSKLRTIVEKLRTLNESVKIVLTVSPVPLAATFDRPSAVQADTVSKSTLRVTVEELLSDGPRNIYYWPSFEIVRWLGAHAPREMPPIFGADDGSTRHVSKWAVEMIIRLFLEHYGEGFEATPA